MLMSGDGHVIKYAVGIFLISDSVYIKNVLMSGCGLFSVAAVLWSRISRGVSTFYPEKKLVFSIHLVFLSIPPPPHTHTHTHIQSTHTCTHTYTHTYTTHTQMCYQNGSSLSLDQFLRWPWQPDGIYTISLICPVWVYPRYNYQC